MKFRVKNTVSRFGVGSIVYLPGDIVEGPEEWARINIHILEPIPEPKQGDRTPSLAIAVPAEEPIKPEEIINVPEEEKISGAFEERHAAADRRPKKR